MKNLVVVAGLLVCLVTLLLLNHQIASAAPSQPPLAQSVDFNSGTPVSAEEGERIAREHLLANAATLGLSRADITELAVDLNAADGASGSRYVKFMQTVGGIEIYNAMLNVTILPNRSVLYVGNRGIANAAENINTRTPNISQNDAIASAADALGLSYDAATTVAGQSSGAVDQKVQFSGGNLSYEPIGVRLMYQPLTDGSLRLVWNLDIYQRDGLHWWDVRVDAVTGEVLEKVDRVITDYWGSPDSPTSDTPKVPALSTVTMAGTFGADIVAPYAPASVVGSYRVYPVPIESPIHSTPASPADGRTLVANPDNATASPFGWHDTNGAAGAEFTTTQGNNAHAYTDIDANNSPDAGSSPDGGAGLLFDSPLDLTLPPSGYRPAAVTNLFYWANVQHDVSHIHGFSEPFRNFQENNYGNGGLGSDYINMEAQDGSETNNARYFPAAEGSNPRVQMYIWTAPTPDRDGDLDNGIVLHEYGHGISIRLTGNGTSCLNNAEQMGEGWSDFQSIMYTQKPEHTGALGRGVGTYALNQPTTGAGIRPARYSTDMTINNYTYGRLPTLAVPHGVGFLWATMIWDLNWKLIDAHGFNPSLYGDWSTGGNNLTYRLVHDGMKIQPCNPGFVDGRNAILAADQALTQGANQCRIWEAFARRGLGFSASQGSSSSTSDGTEAFDLPPQCSGGPTPTPSNTPVPTITPTPGTGNRICSSTVVTIPDANPTGVTSSINVGTAGNISDLNVVLTTTHTWVGDLIFTLSNGSTNVIFFDRPAGANPKFGCNGDDIRAIADDEGGTGAWETSCQEDPAGDPIPAYVTGGTYTNNSPLSAFDGAPAADTWTLTVSDNAAQDTGTLDGWCLDIATGGGGPTPPPPTPPTGPDINVTPGAFAETHNSPPQTTNDTMNIQNTGTGSLTWTIVEDNSSAGKVLTTKGTPYVYDGPVTALPQGAFGFSNSGVAGDTIINTPNVAAGDLLITHSSTQNITSGNSVSCNAGGLHAENSYYRVYDLAGDFGITQTIEVDEVSFGVEQATGATGTQPVTVNLYTLTGVLNTANLTLIGSEAVDVPDSATGTVFSVPVSPEVTVPAGSVLVVELLTPDGQTASNSFFIGSNTDAETDASYLRAPDCGIAEPTATGEIGFPDMHIVMNVSAGVVGGGGTCDAPSDIPWLTVSPTNGSTAGGGSTPVTLTYNSASLATGTYTGTLCIESNDPDEDPVTVPITLTVGLPTAIDLASFTSPIAGVNLGDLAAAGLLFLAGIALMARRK